MQAFYFMILVFGVLYLVAPEIFITIIVGLAMAAGFVIMNRLVMTGKVTGVGFGLGVKVEQPAQ